MKYLFLLLISYQTMASTSLLTGKVESETGCSKKVMVWLSLDKEEYKERLLLMHTEVPVKGSFSFYVKPGNYQVRASDESGCEFFQRVSVKETSDIQIKLVKK